MTRTGYLGYPFRGIRTSGFTVADTDKTQNRQPPLISEAELLLAVSRAAKNLMHFDNWRDAMPAFLAELGKHTGSTRVWMFRVAEQTATYYVTDYIFEWVSDPIWSNINDPYMVHKKWDLSIPELRDLYEARTRGETLQHHVNELTGGLHEALAHQGIQSMLTIPIMVDGQWWGLLGLDDNEAPRHYTPAHLAALETGGVLITNMILRDRMRWEADHDYLTRLYNRRYLVRLMEQAIAAGRNGGFIMLDADWFKSINDGFGHQAGDQALIHIAGLLEAHVPAGSCCARFGGEEFAIWVPEHSGASRREPLQQIAEQLRHVVSETPLHWQGQAIRISMSLGVASSHNLPDFESLISLADQALFDAKARGRNCVVVRN